LFVLFPFRHVYSPQHFILQMSISKKVSNYLFFSSEQHDKASFSFTHIAFQMNEKLKHSPKPSIVLKSAADISESVH